MPIARVQSVAKDSNVGKLVTVRRIPLALRAERNPTVAVRELAQTFHRVLHRIECRIEIARRMFHERALLLFFKQTEHIGEWLSAVTDLFS